MVPSKSADVGNYHNYYGPRRSGSSDRLKMFEQDWFNKKECADLGCNSGHLSFSIAEHFGPKLMLGIDCDSSLISRALQRLRMIPSTTIPVKVNNLLIPRAVSMMMDRQTKIYPHNLAFQCSDILELAGDKNNKPQKQFDTVICCSVSKWVHLNHGDVGIKKLFQTMFDLLVPGGIAVLEYQPWKSYERKKNTSLVTRAMFNEIVIRPDDFEGIITQDIGFEITERRGPPLADAKGFNRPILVLSKPKKSPVNVSISKKESKNARFEASMNNIGTDPDFEETAIVGVDNNEIQSKSKKSRKQPASK